MTKFDNSTQRVNSIFLKINQTLIKLKFNIDFAFSGGTAYNIQWGEVNEVVKLCWTNKGSWFKKTVFKKIS